VTATVSRKLGIREDVRALYVNAPAGVVDTIEPPPLRYEPDADGRFDYIHLFTTTGADLDARFPGLRDQLAPGGMLWVSWPKGGQQGTDLRLPEVIRIGYSHGLVESKSIGIDATWSALRFTWQIPGKVYANSFGTLPD
jgi:hypothetical protein